MTKELVKTKACKVIVTVRSLPPNSLHRYPLPGLKFSSMPQKLINLTTDLAFRMNIGAVGGLLNVSVLLHRCT